MTTNTWIINKSDFENIIINNGKIILIEEDPMNKYMENPYIITAGALLPPVESVQFYLNDDYSSAMNSYYNYLMNEGNPYICIILTTILSGNIIGISFGTEELDLVFANMLLNFLKTVYGLYEISNSQLIIDDKFLPYILSELYYNNYINYETFMILHPVEYKICDKIIPIMAYREHPWVESNDIVHYTKYFNDIKNNAHILGYIPQELMSSI